MIQSALMLRDVLDPGGDVAEELGFLLGPGAATACQPMSGMRCGVGLRDLLRCRVGVEACR